MDRKLAFCLEQELTDTQAELKLCKQRESDLIDWLTKQSLTHTNYAAYVAYRCTLNYLKEQYVNTTSNI